MKAQLVLRDIDMIFASEAADAMTERGLDSATFRLLLNLRELHRATAQVRRMNHNA